MVPVRITSNYNNLENENDRLIENQHSQNEEDINNGIKHLYIELESFIITFKYFCNKAHGKNIKFHHYLIEYLITTYIYI